MTTEHQSVLAQMAKLQGTIDECKKNLQQGSNNNNNNNPTTSSAATINNPPPPSNYYSRVNSALPHVTKTTWKLNRQQANLIRPQLAARSTKLILNRPTPTNHTTTIQAKPTTSQLAPPTTNTTPSSSAPTTTLSVAAQPFKPSSLPTPNQLTTTNNNLGAHSTQTPAISIAPTAQNMSPSPVAQTATNLSNMSLAPNQPPPVSVTRSPSSATAIKSNELVIDGVSFVRDSQGKKLVRKTELAPPQPVHPSEKPAPVPSTSAPDLNVQKATPIKALIGGMTYVRTKSGNLVELSALKKFQSQQLQEIKRAKLLATVNAMKSRYASSVSRPYPPYPPSSSLNNTWAHKKLGPQPLRHSKVITKVSRPPVIKKNEQCRFFAKTGACRNGLTCVYQHDPLQVAICSRYLRKKCSYSATSCPLSHKPNPHNMEHCSHFPRCNKADCPYPHVKPTSSQICPEFADLGWCSKGAQCTERHVRECPEFSTKGTCSNPGCRLRHMINRNHNQNESLEESTSHHEDEDHRMAADDEAGSSDEEAPDTAGSTGLFFTDLTGTHDPKGKRKATHPPSSKAPVDPHHQQRTFKGISHNTEVGSPTVKRIKYDQMADNSDFVMFISSDEEQGTSPTGPPSSSKKDQIEPVEISSEEENDDDEEEEEGQGEKDVDVEEMMDVEEVEEHESAVDPSSVDSEELDSVLMDHHHLLSLDHHHQLEEELEAGCAERIHEEVMSDERIHEEAIYEERIEEDEDKPLRVERIQEDQGPGFLEAAKEEDEEEEDDKPLPTPTHPLPPRPPSPCFPASPGPLIFSAHRAPLNLFPLTLNPSHHHQELAPPPVSPVIVVKPRNRSSLEPGEEIEEGEIFDDDDEEEEEQDPPSETVQIPRGPSGPQDSHQQGQLDLGRLPSSSSSGNSNSHSLGVEEGLDSEDDDELVARLLLGNPHHPHPHYFF